jgi:hypothetical protein
VSAIFSSTTLYATGPADLGPWPTGRYLDRTQTGVEWAVYHPSSAASALFQMSYSTDNGSTWTAGPTQWNGSNNPALFIDLDDYAHLVYVQAFDGDGRLAGHLYYQRGVPNPGRTSYSWSTPLDLYSYQGPITPDLVAHREGTGWAVHIVHGESNNLDFAVRYLRVDVTANGTATPAAGSMTNLSPDAAGSGNYFPSIDFQHTGDGKTVASATPHLFVGWNARTTGTGKGVRFRKGFYSGGAWAWNPERELDNTLTVSAASVGDWQQTLFDGTRVVIVGWLSLAGGDGRLVMLERDAADTTTTSRTLVTTTAPNTGNANVLAYGQASHDGAGNMIFVGVDTTGTTGSRKLNVRKWTRSGATLGAITTLDASASATPMVKVRRNPAGGYIGALYTEGTTSPYVVTFIVAMSLNVAPNAPTGLSPTANEPVNRNNPQTLRWAFSDPDVGDSQSAYQIQMRDSGTTPWTTNLSGTTPNQFHLLAAGAITTNGTKEWQVRTADSDGVWGAWSSSSFFVAATPATPPTLITPTNNATIPGAIIDASWSLPGQTSYELRIVADAAGTPDTSTVLFTTGVVTSTAKSLSVALDSEVFTNGRVVHVQVRGQDASTLFTSFASNKVTMSYTPPAAPTVTTQVGVVRGAVVVSWLDPVPAGSQPAVSTHNVWRRVKGDTGSGKRKAVNRAINWTDYEVVSGVEYEYRIETVGVNRTSTFSQWSAATAGVYAGNYQPSY